MEGFLDVLYEYAQEQGIAPYLETWEYRRATYDLEAEWRSEEHTSELQSQR